MFGCYPHPYRIHLESEGPSHELRKCTPRGGMILGHPLDKWEFGGNAPAGNACLVLCVSLLPKPARYRYCKAFDKLEFV